MQSKTAHHVRDIRVGHYDKIMRTGFSVRRSWHQLKFERVLELLPAERNQSILDVGCFAGSFLSLCDAQRFSRQLGVDILEEQIEYASRNYRTPYREFRHIADLGALFDLHEKFHNVVAIELIEHLSRKEINLLLRAASGILPPGGRFTLTTPNYSSLWPIIEWAVNRLGDIDYAEQHVTRCSFGTLNSILATCYPQFESEFELEVLTTTHLAAPFLAVFGVPFAKRISSLVSHRAWKCSIGSLIVASYKRR
jgi:2-polyprenyl-3-methyl-5-hydroxy-6-metoxy-1,4-benzoquinol methylase